jgi:hypothetical protein
MKKGRIIFKKFKKKKTVTISTQIFSEQQNRNIEEFMYKIIKIIEKK